MKNFILILFLATSVFYSCASNELKNSDNPEIVYNEAVRLLEDESYLEASEFFAELRRRFPQSRFAVLAELRSADMDFNQENYIEAAAGYGVFVDLYPRHKEAPYALFRKAQSYFKSAPDLVARDQSSAKNAIVAAQAFLSRYPGAEYKKEVEQILNDSRLKLAQKEAYVARFYHKREAFEAAIRRWQLLIRDYADIKGSKEGDSLLKEATEQISRLQSKIEKGRAS
ncbi:outer membrane protein assembly factor BamD [bacterium]|nr:outer membrane protein assembly factor BamD [bacterium]